LAYLPFYITPEEFAKEQSRQEQEIGAGKNLYTWDCCNIEEAFRWNAVKHTCFALTPVAAIFSLLGYLFYSEWGIFAYFISFVLFTILAVAGYMTMGVDNGYKYTLSSLGIVQKKWRYEPKWVNTAMQAIAGLCAFASLFAIAVVGPMAFAGTGIFLLMGWGMMNRKPLTEEETIVALKEDWLRAEYNSKRRALVLWHTVENCRYQDVAQTNVSRLRSQTESYLFFKTESELEKVVQFFESQGLNCNQNLDVKQLFDGDYQYEKIHGMSVVSRQYKVDEAHVLRANNTPVPEPQYYLEDDWLNKEEWEQRTGRPVVT